MPSILDPCARLNWAAATGFAVAAVDHELQFKQMRAEYAILTLPDPDLRYRDRASSSDLESRAANQ